MFFATRFSLFCFSLMQIAQMWLIGLMNAIFYDVYSILSANPFINKDYNSSTLTNSSVFSVRSNIRDRYLDWWYIFFLHAEPFVKCYSSIM